MDDRGRIGLCERCSHSRVMRSDRGSAFYLCRVTFDDPTFPKYPQLPVLSCSAFAPATHPEPKLSNPARGDQDP